MKQWLRRLMAIILLGSALVTQSGCFYFTRHFLRQTDVYTATTQDCRIATTEAGGDLYARFSPTDFALIAEGRPWLRNPLALRFAQREAGPASSTVFIMPTPVFDPEGISQSATLMFKANVDGGYLSKGTPVSAEASLPTAPSTSYVVHDFNRHYTSNPLRYCVAPVFVIGDVLVNIVTLGFVGGYGCAKQDSGDRIRHGILVFEQP